MQIPSQVTFRHMETSPALETSIRGKIADLEKISTKLISCRVVVECKHNHKNQGNLFYVSIDLRVPGKELVVSRDSGLDHAHEDAYIAVRDSFDGIARQLESHVRRQQGKKKTHQTPPHGRIVELDQAGGFGRIGTPDGREIYFHRNSLTNTHFENLEVGNEVRFAEAKGDQGPQASGVQVVGKHHIVG